MMELNIKSINELKLDFDSVLENNLSVFEKWSFCRSFFYHFINEVSNNPNIAFNNFYAKCRYTLSKLKLEEVDRLNLDAIRRFIKNYNQEVQTEDVNQFVYFFNKIFSGINQSREIQLDNFVNDYFTLKFPIPKIDSDIRILCNNWGDLTGSGSNCHFMLSGYDLNDLNGELKVVIRDFEFTKFSYLHGLLEIGAILHLKNIGKVDNRNNYTTNISTLISLEPDFLVDAAGVGECFQFSKSRIRAKSDIFIFSRLVKDLPGNAALKGSFVGHYLDAMVRRETNYEKIFEDAKILYPLKSAQVGNEIMNEIKNSINREHLPNLKVLVDNECQTNAEIWIEPTYFSKEYGIQGRIDLLRINQDQSKDIVELKSGTPSNPKFSIAWPGHKYQVVNYDLLLNSTYGNNRQGSNSVFYSRCQNRPYRNIVSESKEKQRALIIRNRIVKSIYKLSQNDFNILENIKNKGISFLPIFRNKALTYFQSVYGVNDIVTKYYNEMIAFVLRELINAKVGGGMTLDTERKQNGFASLWLDTLEEKKGNFSIIPQLKVRDVDSNKGRITLGITEEVPHSFRKKDLVILYPKINGKYNALINHILKGTIFEINSSEIIISIFNKQTDYNFIRKFDFWAIESDIFERNYWSKVSNLFNVLGAEERKCNLLLGEEEPKLEHLVKYSSPYLNENQNTLIENALNAKDYYLLQGPPGTGKTSTFLVNYLREIIKNKIDKIIILAFTNRAVDKICESLNNPRFGNSIDYVRLGSKYTKDDFFFNDLAKRKGKNPDDWRNIIEFSQVIISTVATFQNICLLLERFMVFDQLIVDEASQLTEADLSGVVVQFNKFVLIGDQKQLPAVIAQNELGCQVREDQLHNYEINDLRISLFERLYNNAKKKGWKKCYGQLTTHYRMHEIIANEISRHYELGLTVGLEKQKSSLPIYDISLDRIQGNIGNGRLVFINCKPGSLPKKNKEEANLCALIVNQLLENGYSTKEIGIITPFRAQITAIKKELLPSIRNDEFLIIDTVERFQGDERKIIIFSTSVSDRSKIASIQSIAPNDYEQRTDRKLLVSLSRASEQFIVLGNSDILESSENYAKLITSIKRQNWFYNFN